MKRIVFLNGQFLPEEQATVSVFDRSFLYGDGLFETIRIAGGRPFRWSQHWARLHAGAQFLQIQAPFTETALAANAAELLRRTGVTEGVLRVTVSRGIGPRGYSPRGAGAPVVVMSVQPAPKLVAAETASWAVATSALRINEHDPLLQFKTANKLHQVLGRAEAEEKGAQEVLFQNLRGEVAECASSNVFWIAGERVFTPPLACGALPGITRGVVIELCREMEVSLAERICTHEQVAGASGVFLTLSSAGLVEAESLDGQPLGRSALTRRLQAAYCALVEKESAG